MEKHDNVEDKCVEYHTFKSFKPEYSLFFFTLEYIANHDDFMMHNFYTCVMSPILYSEIISSVVLNYEW